MSSSSSSCFCRLSYSPIVARRLFQSFHSCNAKCPLCLLLCLFLVQKMFEKHRGDTDAAPMAKLYIDICHKARQSKITKYILFDPTHPGHKARRLFTDCIEIVRTLCENHVKNVQHLMFNSRRHILGMCIPSGGCDRERWASTFRRAERLVLGTHMSSGGCGRQWFIDLHEFSWILNLC